LVPLVEVKEGVLRVKDRGDVREEQCIEKVEAKDHEVIEHPLIYGDGGL
jgi:hypothetical protein